VFKSSVFQEISLLTNQLKSWSQVLFQETAFNAVIFECISVEYVELSKEITYPFHFKNQVQFVVVLVVILLGQSFHWIPCIPCIHCGQTILVPTHQTQPVLGQ
jgi:hypothetical protein